MASPEHVFPRHRKQPLPASRSNPMRTLLAAHLYLVGQTVTLDPGGGFVSKTGDMFIVRAQLPPLGDVLQYRIKSDDEPYERVVAETQLTRASPTGGSAAGVFVRATASLVT